MRAVQQLQTEITALEAKTVVAEVRQMIEGRKNINPRIVHMTSRNEYVTIKFERNEVTLNIS